MLTIFRGVAFDLRSRDWAGLRITSLVVGDLETMIFCRCVIGIGVK